jgi:hypothetical protein
MKKAKNVSKNIDGPGRHKINTQINTKLNRKIKNNTTSSYSIYENIWSRVIDALDNPLWRNLYNKFSFRIRKRLKDRPRGKTSKVKIAKKLSRGNRK